MAGQPAAGNTVSLLVLVDLPQNDGLVTRCAHNHLRVVDWDGDGRHHVGVSPHGTLENEAFGTHGSAAARVRESL